MAEFSSHLPSAFLVVALVSALFSIAAYTACHLAPAGPRQEVRRAWGRNGVDFAALMAGLAFVWMAVFFATGQYRFDYVYHNSSRDLSLYYRIGSVWAGQEGSFLLWSLWACVIGIIFARKAGRAEASSMPFYGLVLAFVLLMTLLVNPFRTSGEPRADGMGLNPLLQDPWMVIHPPTLFLGYALTAVPFALAMGALVRRDYRDWIRSAAPWAITAGTVLLTALSMGGHWAYRTLGWGGFWGWDPVENGSLVPMLLSFALVHTILLQRGPSAPAQRGSIGLAIAAFLSMLYAGYLTRSGVLTEFSNHSFSELPHGRLLLVGLVGFVALGAGLFALRYRGIPSNRAYDDVLSRDFGFYLAAVVLSISAVLVAVGTSTPIFTGWSGKASTVQPSFYDWTLAPVGVLIGLMLAVYPLTTRDGTRPERLKRSLPPALVVAVIAAAFAVWQGDDLKPAQLAAAVGLVFSGVLAGYLNLQQVLRKARAGGFSSAGGYLAHVGAGVLLAGIVVSAVYTRTERVRTDIDGKGAAFGYRYRLLKEEMVSGNRTVVPIWASRPGQKPPKGRDTGAPPSWWQRVSGQAGIILRPSMMRDRNGNQMTSPGIHSFPTHDVYVAPVEFDPGAWESLPVTLGVNEVYQFEQLKVMFLGLQELGHQGSPDWGIEAQLLAVRGNEHQMVKPQLNLTSLAGTIESLPGGARININPNTGFDKGLTFDLIGPNARRLPAWVVVDVTLKPFIWVVWLGMVLTMLGGLMAAFHRARQMRRSQAELVGVEESTRISALRT